MRLPLSQKLVARARQMAKHCRRSLLRPRVSGKQLMRELKALGVCEGGVLLVHSSLSALGNVVGGPSTVIESLINALGPEGTLLMPSHTWLWMDRGCRVFDVRETKSCTGVITEVFRSRPDVIRSLHPTHSLVARGARAEQLISGHQRCETPCGPTSPYGRILDANAQILFLGATLKSNTIRYTVEELAGVGYLLEDNLESYAVIDSEKKQSQVFVRRYRRGFPRRSEDLKDELVANRIARQGAVGDSLSYLLEGSLFRDYILSSIELNPKYMLAS